MEIIVEVERRQYWSVEHRLAVLEEAASSSGSAPRLTTLKTSLADKLRCLPGQGDPLARAHRCPPSSELTSCCDGNRPAAKPQPDVIWHSDVLDLCS